MRTGQKGRGKEDWKSRGIRAPEKVTGQPWGQLILKRMDLEASICVVTWWNSEPSAAQEKVQEKNGHVAFLPATWSKEARKAGW